MANHAINHSELKALIPADIANNVQFASPNSQGPNAQVIGWIDFGSAFNIANNGAPILVRNTLPGGYQVSFNIALNATTTGSFLDQIAFISSPSPSFSKAAFGNTTYTGIGGNPILILNNNYPIGEPVFPTLTITNLQVTNSCGVSIDNFIFYAADAETTTVNSSQFVETWSMTTNSTPWQLTAVMPNVNQTLTGPIVTGLNTLTVTETADTTVLAETDACVFSSIGPSELQASCSTDGGRQAFAFGLLIQSSQKPNLDLRPPVCLYKQPVQYVNTVIANVQQIYCLESPDTQSIVSIKYGNTTYYIQNNTISISGSLGTYTFSSNQIQLKQTTGALPITTDVFLVSIKKCNELYTFYVPFTLQANC